MRDGGVMRFELYPEKAPITVASFAEAAKNLQTSFEEAMAKASQAEK